jgi:hypothetical protein
VTTLDLCLSAGPSAIFQSYVTGDLHPITQRLGPKLHGYVHALKGYLRAPIVQLWCKRGLKEPPAGDEDQWLTLLDIIEGRGDRC